MLTETYQAGVLPQNFHQRVIEMENAIECRKSNKADETYAAQILELMSLYSVRKHV